MTQKLKLWLWLSVVMVIAGALLLFPIGRLALNVVFVIVKIGMLTGLFILLFSRKKFGFYIWALFSVGAVIMTLIKWNIIGSASFLIIASIVVDILMPVVAYMFMKKRWSEF
ncbi:MULTISPECIES: hypothetical protein [Clostridium]|jgi:large-conductance mechanosensitive channel|uniref:ABC transporter permease n=1 Tax=Clostridium lapidicellarium TaxID=3240931 RepID=A0ABV4DWW3_9CLOT|nr:hypothetical protein [uncultured Clostridium sp.]NLU07776.1 hypothetical protein [Clostridiales bacterium]